MIYCRMKRSEGSSWVKGSEGSRMEEKLLSKEKVISAGHFLQPDSMGTRRT